MNSLLIGDDIIVGMYVMDTNDTDLYAISVNFNVENRREELIIPISFLYPIYSVLIRSHFLLCFLRELLTSALNIDNSLFAYHLV